MPDEVTARLERLATREHMSVSAFVVRELTALSRRADNRALLDGLPDLDIDVAGLLEDLDAGRSHR